MLQDTVFVAAPSAIDWLAIVKLILEFASPIVMAFVGVWVYSAKKRVESVHTIVNGERAALVAQVERLARANATLVERLVEAPLKDQTVPSGIRGQNETDIG